jgi:hypothetical protein
MATPAEPLIKPSPTHCNWQKGAGGRGPIENAPAPASHRQLFASESRF